MSARNELYELINQLIEDGHTILPGSHTARKIGDLLDRIEDSRSHLDAERLRNEAKLHEHDAVDCTGREKDHYLRTAGVLVYAAGLTDPYEERNGQLVNKRTGQPVTL